MSMFMLYAALFREKARRETREVTFSGHLDIPNDSYGFLEFYCPDPECDCQMVMLGQAKNNNSGNEGKVSQRRRKQTLSVPKVMQARHDEIVALAEAFCEVRLNEEYAALCRQMAAALARKRPSPLASGKTNMWACAILYALGQVNFLFDKSQKLNISADELCGAFGVSKSAASAKARQIREALDIYVLDPKWSLPSQMDENPMAWMITVDGFMADARTASREVQKEAYRKGLIPYIPADKR